MKWGPLNFVVVYLCASLLTSHHSVLIRLRSDWATERPLLHFQLTKFNKSWHVMFVAHLRLKFPRVCVCVGIHTQNQIVVQSSHNHLSIRSSTFLFSHPLLHLWLHWPFCTSCLGQGHGNKSQPIGCSAFTSICCCSSLKAAAVRAAGSLAGQLAGTCEIRARHISLSEALSHIRPQSRASTTAAALTSPAPFPVLPSDWWTKPASTKTEHCWAILSSEEFLLIPPGDADSPRLWDSLKLCSGLTCNNIVLTGVQLILLQPKCCRGQGVKLKESRHCKAIWEHLRRPPVVWCVHRQESELLKFALKAWVIIRWRSR